MALELYPDLPVLQQGWLPVGDGHAIYWQLSGNLKGLPVVWLHGGPGSAASPLHRRFFDPDRFLIIQYDQRGCGLSRAEHRLVHNQTSDLVSDIEKLRVFLSITRWSVVAGSWGAGLALAYAQKHNSAIEHLLLRSTFLCSPAETDMFMNHPPQACLERWQDLNRQLPRNGTESLLEYGHRVFCLEQNTATQSALALSWARYESAMNAFPEPPPEIDLTSGETLISRYQIQCHYLFHGCFVTRSALLAPDALQELDITLIHGVEDALCPVSNSEAVFKAVPRAQLINVPDCGHDLANHAMQEALLGVIGTW